MNDAQTNAALTNLCRILKVPQDSTAPNRAMALRLLVRVYVLPLIRNGTARRDEGNAILRATSGHFDQWSRFVVTLGQEIVMMQIAPYYYATLNMSNADLIARYRRLSGLIWWIETLGIAVGATNTASAANAGVAEGIKSSSVKAGLKRAGERFVGRGAVADAVIQRFGVKMPPRGGPAIAIVGLAASTVAYHSAREQVRQIRFILMHRYKSGQAKQAEAAAVLQPGQDVSDIRRYWEYH